MHSILLAGSVYGKGFTLYKDIIVMENSSIDQGTVFNFLYSILILLLSQKPFA